MHPRLQLAFSTFSPLLRVAIAPILEKKDFAAILTSTQISQLKQKTGLDDDALAIQLLPLAAAYAITPLSRFNVGAIARAKSGYWYFGANMEFLNTAIQQSVHAEQSAIVHAWANNECGLEAITVNYSPCGHCRQFMNELNSQESLRICLPGQESSLLCELLPKAFGPADLAISTRLMDPVDHAYRLTGDTLERTAIAAANRSYAPYSESHIGIALETHEGAIYQGAYLENAAFNPSLPPLQSALILMNLKNEHMTQIKRACVAESVNIKIGGHAIVEEMLGLLGCHDLGYINLQK